MKKTAIGLILLMVLAVISVNAEENSKTKAEKMIGLCERAQAKLDYILDKIENNEAEELFREAGEELDKAKKLYNEEEYDGAIESCLEAMHKFRESAVLIREEAGGKIKDMIEGQIERMESYISRIKEIAENEEIIALLDNAESHLEKARMYLENGEAIKAESEVRKAANILKNLREQWKSRYGEKIKQRLEKLNETAKKRIQFYEQALDKLREEGYDVQDLERDLNEIKNDLNNVNSLINEGKYKEALPKIRELYREMQEFQEKLRGIRNES